MELQQIIRVNDDLVCVCVREDGTTELPKWNDADLQPVVVDFQARAKKLVATMAVDPPRTKKSADVAGSRSTVQTFGKRISCCSQPDCRRVDMRCSSDASFFRVCGRCKVARYCSRECQVAHWSAHKRECQTIDKTQSVRRKVRCLCQTLYASSNKLMAFAKKCKADTQRQFMDIQLDTLSENNTVDEMLCVAVWRRMVQLATTTMLSTVTALLTELREHEYQGVVVRVSHAMGSERVFLEFVAGPQKT